jgi:hypothetical protein
MPKEKRKPLGNKMRFEVFKRDLFRCQYCGETPPKVVLEVDHIHPVSMGGKNEIDNLLTACFQCNRGKSKFEITTLPESTSTKAALLKEKEEQYREYHKIQLEIEQRVQMEIEMIAETYHFFFPDCQLGEDFKNYTVRNFLIKLGYPEVHDAMTIACNKRGPGDRLKYFCGICWNRIKGN